MDPGLALELSADVLRVWQTVAQWPAAQPFSGGVWDAWPARMAEGVAVCRVESEALTQYLLGERRHG